jgi:hypothetical protein
MKALKFGKKSSKIASLSSTLKERIYMFYLLNGGNSI